MVTKYFTIVLVCGVWMASQAFGQASKILPWSDGDLTETGKCAKAYHPEPIIFIHGITASRIRWTNVISYVQSSGWFTKYHYIAQKFEDAKESSFNTKNQEDYEDWEVPADERDQWQDIEQPYIHTWNYGRHARGCPAVHAIRRANPGARQVETFPLADANRALLALKQGKIRGAGVLVV